MTEHPTTVHRRCVALVFHYRRGDMTAVGDLLDEIAGRPETAGAVLAGLVQLVNRALDERPAVADEWLAEALLTLAKAEDQRPPHS